jgi:hypothetical protein
MKIDWWRWLQVYRNGLNLDELRLSCIIEGEPISLGLSLWLISDRMLGWKSWEFHRSLVLLWSNKCKPILIYFWDLRLILESKTVLLQGIECRRLKLLVRLSRKLSRRYLLQLLLLAATWRRILSLDLTTWKGEWIILRNCNPCLLWESCLEGYSLVHLWNLDISYRIKSDLEVSRLISEVLSLYLFATWTWGGVFRRETIVHERLLEGNKWLLRRRVGVLRVHRKSVSWLSLRLKTEPLRCSVILREEILLTRGKV